MPNPFKKVFHGKDKKKSSSKKKSSVDNKNRIFTQAKHATPRPQSQAYSSQAPLAPGQPEENRPKIIGEAYMTPVSPVSNYPARNPYAQDPVVASSSLPYQPTRPSKLRNTKNADSDASDNSGSESEGGTKKNNRSELLRDSLPDTSHEGIGFFILRNHTMTSMCFGYNLDKLDAIRKASMFLFVFLATLYTALATITHPGQTTGAQVGISVLLIPAAMWGLKALLIAFRNPRATGWIALGTVLLVDLIMFILAMWQTWTLITDYSADLWDVLILWAENYALNQVLEIPGLLIHYFCQGRGCSCCKLPSNFSLV